MRKSEIDTGRLDAAFGTAAAGSPMLARLHFLFEIEKLKGELLHDARPPENPAAPWPENAAEQSWHLAMFALVLREYAAEPVDTLRALEMTLIYNMNPDDFTRLPPADAAHYIGLSRELMAGATAEARYARAIEHFHGNDAASAAAPPLAFAAAENNDRLFNQLRFLSELKKLRAVQRTNLTNATRDQMVLRVENTAEHSWHIPVFAAVFRDQAKGQIDIMRCLEMLLIHDIVEIDAGDANCYGALYGSAEQHEREVNAANRIFGLLPADQASYYNGLWNEFEDGQTDDAHYVRAIDRSHPTLFSFLIGGRTWRAQELLYEKAVARHEKTVTDGAPEVWQAIKRCLDHARDHHFFYEPETTPPVSADPFPTTPPHNPS